MKTKTFPESNYHAIYINGKTLRFPIDPRKSVTTLEYPEFYDVKITNRCNGNCPYCYQSSTAEELHYEDIVDKAEEFFGAMSANQRPFQVAIGGGEPTMHPEFGAFCKKLKELGIDPNYSTNGTLLTDAILDITEQYVNGVAVSCHPHLPWRDGVEKLLGRGIYTNLHIIISDEDSVQRFLEIYGEFHGKVKHFVLLPLVAQGRATDEFACWPTLKAHLDSLEDRSDVAFGALFYPYLPDLWWDISIYEPEAFSQYLVMDDMSLHPSSFS